MGGLGGYTQDPSYSTWERFRQEIIKRYIGIEEEPRALEEMDNIIHKGRIDTYLLLLENLNIKAGLTGIAWRVKVESKLPQDVLRRLSHFKFNDDDHWIETLREVGRQEEELLEHGKLSQSISTPHNPAPKRKREGSEKGFNTKFQKKNDNKPRKDNTSRWNLHGQQLQSKPVKIPKMSIPTGRKLMKELPKKWLKKGRGKSNALVAPSTTTPRENVESRL